MEDVGQTAAAELKKHGKLQIIRWEFWTGQQIDQYLPVTRNLTSAVSLYPLRLSKKAVGLVDQGMSHLSHPSVDFGEMIAEMYALWL